MIFFTIVLISILSGAEVDLFIPSFPELQNVFHLTPVMVQLTLSVNFIAYCVCSLFAGALGDRFNRRHVMLVSLMVFVIGSVFCVTAQNFYMLLAGRLLQGVGMAGPSALAYAIISDLYPLSRQAGLMAMLNGLTSGMMAFAPLIGSYINFYFDWRGNFVVLLLLSTVCLLTAYFYIPHRPGDAKISLSPKAYWPLFRSAKLMTFIMAFCCLVNVYWMFVGMAPILYMKVFGVSLKEYGYYQGSLAAAFSILSLFSGRILHRFGQKRCLYAGIWTIFASLILMILITLFKTQHPLLVTFTLLIFSVGIVFPINIMFPLTLSVIENTKGRTTALFMAIRLVVTALALETAGYFYADSIVSTGVVMITLLVAGLYLIWRLHARRWLVLEN